jgi:YidC/Oxa1 family membrane protein insertase
MAYLNEERTELESGDEIEVWSDKGSLKWAGIRNQYFLVALAPRDSGYYRVELKAPATDQLSIGEGYSYKVGARIGNSGGWGNLLYLGPLSYDELASYNADLEQSINLGFPVIRQISRGLLIVFLASYQYIPNYGLVIILIAVAIKILVYPLTHKSYESMAKMQQLQPKIAALREKFKNDNQRLSRETMKLYKEEGANPLGGCLPMLLQMPIFFALYNVFSSTIELRQAPFLLWINDLSQPDVIDIGGFELHVLPLLMAGSMFVQQKMTMKDPKQAFLVYLMPAFMVFIFWSISSGLVLYWTIFNVLSIGQQILMNRIQRK